MTNQKNLLKMLVLSMLIAPTGAVFGAFLSGVFYRMSKGKIIFAVIGEIIGTGIIGALASYPVMTFLWGKEGLSWIFYIPSFVCGTLIGGSIAYVFLRKIADNGILSQMQNMLASRSYQDKSTLLSNTATIAAFGAILFVIIEVTSDMFKLTSPVFDVLSIASLVACAVIAVIYYILKKVKKSDK